VYRYRCDQCATTSLPVRTRAELHAARDRHRRDFHGGHVPDGEHLLKHRPPLRPADTRAVAWTLAILALLLLAWAIQH
jgi:hypothetical protein